MAAYTSAASGNWASASWTNTGGDPAGDWPFKNRATDTFTIANTHTITIVADNAFAGSGAGVINAGGALTNNFAQTQTFCGAITQSGTFTNNSTFRTSATTTCNAGNIVNAVGATLQYDLAAQGGGGLQINSTAFSLDGTIQGTAGKEAFVYVAGGSTT